MVEKQIVDKDGNIATESESLTVPSNRFFRDAWVLSGDVISEDLTVAKELFKKAIREVREPLLLAEDVVFMKAIESGDSSAQSASATKKQSLRDAPASSAITNATTIAELKSAWDTNLLGTNPYS